MRHRSIVISIMIFIFTVGSSLCFAASEVTSSAIPLPPALLNLPTIETEPWVQIDPGPGVFLEGPAFNRQGDLFITSVFDGRILKITSDKKVSTIFQKEGHMIAGLVIHKDGRLFGTCISGQLFSVNEDGSGLTYYKARVDGKPARINDGVFDTKGNLYVTDWTGTVPNPTGGIYRFSADFKSVDAVVQGMAAPNGIGMAPQGNQLWVGVMLRNALAQINLGEDGVSLPPITPMGYPYYFSGFPGPDGMAVDSKGHVYQAMNFQGRIVVLRAGIPVAQVLIPGREEAKYLRSTNVAFKPGTADVYITTSGNGGAWVYKFRGLAEGLKLFSHQ